MDGATRGGCSGGSSAAARPGDPVPLVWLTIESLQLFDEIYVTTPAAGCCSRRRSSSTTSTSRRSTSSTPATRRRSPTCCSWRRRSSRPSSSGSARKVVHYRVRRRARPIASPSRRGGRLADRPRIRRRPSAWHLVPVPIALVMRGAVLLDAASRRCRRCRSRARFPPVLFPTRPDLQNYVDAVRQAPFARWFVNSAIVALCAVAGNLLFCSLAATRSRASASSGAGSCSR